MNLQEIKAMPTIHEGAKIHESVFRSYHTLEKIKEMIYRGDSTETIKEIINFLEK
jgi:hypothetical protein